MVVTVKVPTAMSTACGVAVVVPILYSMMYSLELCYGTYVLMVRID